MLSLWRKLLRERVLVWIKGRCSHLHRDCPFPTLLSCYLCSTSHSFSTYSFLLSPSIRALPTLIHRHLLEIGVRCLHSSIFFCHRLLPHGFVFGRIRSSPRLTLHLIIDSLHHQSEIFHGDLGFNWLTRNQSKILPWCEVAPRRG